LLLHKLPRSLTRAAHFWLRQHAFDTPIANAADLFAGDHRREGVEQQDFLHVFGALASERPCSPPRRLRGCLPSLSSLRPTADRRCWLICSLPPWLTRATVYGSGVTGYRECEPQRPGFNTVCADGNHARWGFCANVPSQDCQIEDGDDADGVMGFGLEGQDCCPMGAGWTNYFVNDNANGGLEGRQQAWILVRESGLGLPDGWSVVMKTDGDSTFAYDSDYWTSTDNTLNAETVRKRKRLFWGASFSFLAGKPIMHCQDRLGTRRKSCFF
jgi:hypothetical protein